jgi:hypothetical protein
MLCVHNVSGQPQMLRISDVPELAGAVLHDLVGGTSVVGGDAGVELEVGPYQVRWLKLHNSELKTQNYSRNAWPARGT